MDSKNADLNVIEGFGLEWSRFDHLPISDEKLQQLFDGYFNIFPWEKLPPDAKGFDLGCGTGRWGRLVAPRVGTLHLIDPSARALEVAKKNLAGVKNCEFHLADVGNLPLEPESCDFGYSLGVLHHVPDTPEGVRCCVSLLKPGAPFLLYLYYRFDNRPMWFRALWKVSDLGRKLISRLPSPIMHFVTDVIALTVYLPLARLAKLAAALKIDHFPLSQYKDVPFYTMRNDALDRFGTRLEQRFTRHEIQEMMENAGLENIVFSDTLFWAAVGYKKA